MSTDRLLLAIGTAPRGCATSANLAVFLVDLRANVDAAAETMRTDGLIERNGIYWTLTPAGIERLRGIQRTVGVA